MEMFEVKVFCHAGNLLRRSLIQAFTKAQAMIEAYNVFEHTPNADRFVLE